MLTGYEPKRRIKNCGTSNYSDHLTYVSLLIHLHCAQGQAHSRGFFRLDSGREPVREWLTGLDRDTKKSIGEDIKTLQFSWPVAMPLAGKLDEHLREVRSNIKDRIARVIFTVFDGYIVLLHGFIKKSWKTPDKELRLAKRRLHILRS